MVNTSEWTHVETTSRTTIQDAIAARKYGFTKLPTNKKMLKAFIIDNIEVSLSRHKLPGRLEFMYSGKGPVL